MYFRNKRLGEALAFVRESGADIFCLQEVPEHFLSQLTALYPHHAEAVEMERLLPERPLATYGVVLSRYPIKQSGVIPLDDHQSELPWRTHLLIWLLRPVGWSRIRDRNAVYADIDLPPARTGGAQAGTPHGVTRVINIHLTLSNPGWRLQEFEAAMLQRDPSLPTIVCGDFNILERPHIIPLNWLAGGRISDALYPVRERTLIEERFVSHELTNPLRGSRTQTLARSQLDHILLSHHLTASSAHVLPERHGSDHHPICVEIDS